MKIKYHVYDHALHRFCTDDEIRIAPGGRLYHNPFNGLEDNANDWLLVPKDSTDFTIESATISTDDYANLRQRVRHNSPPPENV